MPPLSAMGQIFISCTPRLLCGLGHCSRVIWLTKVEFQRTNIRDKLKLCTKNNAGFTAANKWRWRRIWSHAWINRFRRDPQGSKAVQESLNVEVKVYRPSGWRLNPYKNAPCSNTLCLPTHYLRHGSNELHQASITQRSIGSGPAWDWTLYQHRRCADVQRENVWGHTKTVAATWGIRNIYLNHWM